MFDPKVLEKIGEYIRKFYADNKKFPSESLVAKEFNLTGRQVATRYGQPGFLIYSADPKLYEVFIKNFPILKKKRQITRDRFDKVKKRHPTIEFLTPVLCQNQRMEIKCLKCFKTTNRHFANVITEAAVDLCENCNNKRNKHSTEFLIREYFENYFNLPFDKIKHPKLINPLTGEKLELDGYNEEMELAFEYRGSPHFTRSFFHKNKESLSKLQERNKIKESLCEENGIKLIVIPNLNWFLEENVFSDWFKNELEKIKVPVHKKPSELKYKVGSYFSIKRDLFKEEVMENFKEAKSNDWSSEEFYRVLIKSISS